VVIVGAVAAGFTVIVTTAEPVDPPYPPEIDAPYIETVVAVVTVGAVQLKLQLRGVDVAADVCVISPLMTWVPDPAENVPADAPTSSPLLGVPLLLRV
jgi:hypothetical protein